MAAKKKTNKKPLPPPPPYAPSANMMNNTLTVSTNRYDDVFYEHSLGQLNKVVTRGSQTFDFSGDGRVILRLEVWGDRCLRFRYGLDELETDFSYGRVDGAAPDPANVSLTEKKKYWLLETERLSCQITRDEGAIKVKDLKSGKVVHEYTRGFQARTTLMKGLEQLRIQLKTDKKEGFFGLGDKSGATDLQGRHYSNWCTDSFGYGEGSDHLYRAIPFYMGLREGLGYGIFLDNTFRTHFDFNSRDDGRTTIWAEGGEFDYFFFFGPDLNTVAADYVALTGTPELPPLWSLGFHQCRWSYYPESRVRQLAADFREKNIPCDALYLDIDYMDGYRCFTWNKEYFPEPKKMINDLRENGFHTVVMIDPGIKVDEDYDVYQSGTEADVWCKRKTGEDMVGPVWPPQCVWPDYTNPEVREWWGPLYRELYLEQGVSGFWNDMNEPAVFKVHHMTFPDDVVHDFEGRWAEHKEAHNVYGMQMARATYEGLKELQPGKRPFLLCRANYSGGQRYAALWTGDNVASWEHLAMANRQCVRLSISGYSFVGTDIGGFVDEPTGELMVRWLQLGIFHPVMRVHSMGNNVDGAAEAESDEVKKAERDNRQDQEPWVYGEPYTSRNREAIELRYRLIPYLYTAFQQHLETGQPLLRNLFFYDQQDPKCRAFGDQFFCGDDFLVAPVVKEGARSLEVYLPKGEWVNWFTHRTYQGGAKYRLKAKLGSFPLFVRAGAIVPHVAPVAHTGKLHHARKLELSVFLGRKKGSGRLYWDAGEGYEHEQGAFLDVDFSYRKSKKKLSILQLQYGEYATAFRQTRIELVGLSRKIKIATVDGEPVIIEQSGKRTYLTVPFQFGSIDITLK